MITEWNTGMSRIFRKARQQDLDRIAEIFSNVLDSQDRGEAVIGWIRGVYPTRKTAEEALLADDLFVLEEDGMVVAVARINQIQMPSYAQAAWQHAEAPDDQVMVLHTLSVDPRYAGRGCGSSFVDFYEQYALEHHCPYLRMDTNQINQAARRLYHRLGYREADIVPCEFNGIPDVKLVCLEKTLI